MKQNTHLRYLTIAALWAAMIFLAIFLIKIPLVNGYANIGDALIFTCALLLPTSYAMGAGAIGACIADIISGYAVYAPFTFAIKAVMVLWFIPFKKAKVKWLRHWLPSLLAGITGALLYFLTDYLLYGMGGAIASLPGNIGQCAANCILYTAIAYILEYKFKK